MMNRRQQQQQQLSSLSRSSSSLFVPVLVFLMLRFSSDIRIITDATSTTTTTTMNTTSVNTKHTTSTTSTRSTSTRSTPSSTSSTKDIYLIVEGNTVPYFYCNNNNDSNNKIKKKNKNKNKESSCNVNHIHHEQQLINKSIQDILNHYNTNTTTTNDSNNHDTTKTISSIQQIDSSYKLINAIYIRITIHQSQHHPNDTNVSADMNKTNTINERTDDTYNNNDYKRSTQSSSFLLSKRMISYIQQHNINGIKNIYISQQHHHQQQQQQQHKKQMRKTKKGKIHNIQQQSQQNTLRQQSTTTRQRRRRRTQQQQEIYSKPLRLVGVDIAHSMIIHNDRQSSNNNNNNQNQEQCHDTQQQNQHYITGHHIRVAVMDSGIDYTHIALGGIGTKTSYTNAFGTSIYDIRNTQRIKNNNINNNNETTIFPNHIIIDGYDTLGDIYSDGQSSLYATNDTNPIDLNGHGTSITHIIRSIGPNIQLIGIKICTTFGTSCPDFAFIRGIEYILDRNQNGIIDNYEYNHQDHQDHIGVHVINLSFGRMYTSSYYSILSKITEQIIAIGIVPVLSSGNYGNVPFILGDVPATPNAITVGATEVNYDDDEEEDIDDDDDQDDFNNDTIAVLRDSNNNNEIRQKRQRKQQQQYIRTMAYYSSRGPVTGGNRIKPDLVSPGGLYKVALASTGNEYHIVQGTSFAAPFVTGGAALLKQKCIHCSPFAIKALLMNHATHAVYSSQIPISTNNGTRTLVDKQQERQEWAPVTLQGSGEMQIHKSLMATYWVYSVEDMNPSISLGLINAATNTIQIQRTLRIVQLTNTTETLQIKYELRSLIHQKAIAIQFTPEYIILDGQCQDEYNVTVTFTIQTQFAPSNHMYSGGAASVDPKNLDYNEIDGWIMISSNTTTQNDDTSYYNSNVDNNDVGIPFHMLLRKAANVTIDNSVTLDDNVFSNLPTNITLNIENHGMELAQIDIYQLLYVSTDQSESEYGSNNPPADIRYIGYRTIPVHKNNSNDTNNHCDTLIEFAIQTWESQQSLAYTHFNIWIDLNYDEIADHTIYNSAYRLSSPHSEMRRIDLQTNIEYCIGYTPDHTTNTANTVLRFCSNDIGIQSTTSKPGNTIISVAISSYSFPDDEVSDIMDYRNITIPQAGIAAPSYDIEPGAVLDNIFVSGTGATPPIMNKDGSASTLPLGLLLFTNSFRSWNSTGSATRNSEALVIVRTGTAQYNENSPDVLIFPMVQDVTGPNCAWEQVITNSTSTDKCNTNHRKLISEPSILPPASRGESTNGFDKYSNPYRHDWIPTSKLKKSRYISSSFKHKKNDNIIWNHHQQRIVQEKEETCPELTVPRLQPILIQRSEYPIPNETFYSAAPTTTIIPDQNNFNNTTDPDITLPSNNHHHSTIPPLTIIDIDDDNDDAARSSVYGLRYIHRTSGMFYVNMIMMIMFAFG